ncbi:hypothetical protein AMECASPLE_005004 [Ameca splendens]|uniref:Uncharacterized protein n=1 Tax=Ameca splendens TaxID=208324 RepID=A0ABV1A6A1_9TELE
MNCFLSVTRTDHWSLPSAIAHRASPVDRPLGSVPVLPMASPPLIPDHHTTTTMYDCENDVCCCCFFKYCVSFTPDVTRPTPFQKFHFCLVSRQNTFPNVLGIIKIFFGKCGTGF